MTDTKLAILCASLWHLRTQCEVQQRTLTEAQRLIDVYREAQVPDERSTVKTQLQHILAELMTSIGHA
jgi:hypothetical protein